MLCVELVSGIFFIECTSLCAVAKPLVVGGTSKSHELSLVYDEASLSVLDPPLVLQEFVNHGRL